MKIMKVKSPTIGRIAMVFCTAGLLILIIGFISLLIGDFNGLYLFIGVPFALIGMTLSILSPKGFFFNKGDS